MNKYIEEEYLYYFLNKPCEQQKIKVNEGYENNNNINSQVQKINVENIPENEEIYDKNKKINIKLDGNCLLNEILSYLGIEQTYTQALRKLIANEASNYSWEQETLDALNIKDKTELIKKINENYSFSGYKDITPFLIKYKIVLKIWLEDDRYKGNGWLNINDNYSRDHNIIKVSFKQGKHPELDLEGHYSGIIKDEPEKIKNLKTTLKNELIIIQRKLNTNNIKKLIN